MFTFKSSWLNLFLFCFSVFFVVHLCIYYSEYCNSIVFALHSDVRVIKLSIEYDIVVYCNEIINSKIQLQFSHYTCYILHYIYVYYYANIYTSHRIFFIHFLRLSSNMSVWMSSFDVNYYSNLVHINFICSLKKNHTIIRCVYLICWVVVRFR